MGYAGDHDNDDELAFDSGPRRGGGLFTDDSKSQDSISVTQGAGPVALVDVVTRDNAPHLVTVNLATPVGQLASPVGIYVTRGETVAILDFGVGGSAYRAEVDYGVGVQFSALVSRLKIAAEYRVIPGATTPTPPPSLILAASVGAGVVAVPRCPTRTLGHAYLHAGNMPPLGTLSLTIPMFAKSVIVYAFATAGVPSLDVEQLGMTGAGIVHTPVVVWPSWEIPLTNEARTLLLTNTSAFDLFEIRATFQLAL